MLKTIRTLLLASLSLCGVAAFAQVATPPSAATGSLLTWQLQTTNPTVGSACTSTNILTFNYLTGDFEGCLNGTIQTVPQRLRTGVSTNTDLAGSVTLSSGSGTYTFTQTYTSAPICVATDSTAANAVKASASATVLTLTGTTTDVISYVCVGRN